jgi:hypothetical protein
MAFPRRSGTVSRSLPAILGNFIQIRFSPVDKIVSNGSGRAVYR